MIKLCLTWFLRNCHDVNASDKCSLINVHMVYVAEKCTCTWMHFCLSQKSEHIFLSCTTKHISADWLRPYQTVCMIIMAAVIRSDPVVPWYTNPAPRHILRFPWGALSTSPRTAVVFPLQEPGISHVFFYWFAYLIYTLKTKLKYKKQRWYLVKVEIVFVIISEIRGHNQDLHIKINNSHSCMKLSHWPSQPKITGAQRAVRSDL